MAGKGRWIGRHRHAAAASWMTLQSSAQISRDHLARAQTCSSSPAIPLRQSALRYQLHRRAQS